MLYISRLDGRGVPVGILPAPGGPLRAPLPSSRETLRNKEPLSRLPGLSQQKGRHPRLLEPNCTFFLSKSCTVLLYISRLDGRGSLETLLAPGGPLRAPLPSSRETWRNKEPLSRLPGLSQLKVDIPDFSNKTVLSFYRKAVLYCSTCLASTGGGSLGILPAPGGPLGTLLPSSRET